MESTLIVTVPMMSLPEASVACMTTFTKVLSTILNVKENENWGIQVRRTWAIFLIAFELISFYGVSCNIFQCWQIILKKYVQCLSLKKPVWPKMKRRNWTRLPFSMIPFFSYPSLCLQGGLSKILVGIIKITLIWFCSEFWFKIISASHLCILTTVDPIGRSRYT